MKKRKLLSIVLSLALVFSMTAAFTVASSAGQNEDVKDTTVIYQTPDSINICGESNMLSKGGYLYLTTEGTLTANRADSDSTKGYIYYNTLGQLELHNFKLNTSITSEEIIEANGDPSEGKTGTLFIKLYGKNYLNFSGTSDCPAIVANNALIDIMAGDATGSLEANAYIGGGNGINIHSGTISLSSSSDKGNCSDPALFTNGYAYNWGWNKTGNVTISGGNVTIDGFECGIASSSQVIVDGGMLTIKNTKQDTTNCHKNYNGNAIYAVDDVKVLSGSVVINNFDRNGIYSGDNVNVSGGSVLINEYTYTSKDYNWDPNYTGNGIKANNVNISGQACVTIKDNNVVGELGERGITAIINLNITGGILTIYGFDSGIFMGKNEKNVGDKGADNIVIKDAVVKITAPNDGIGGQYNSFTIENSDVEVLSTATEVGHYAFWKEPTISGSSIIKAGENKFNAVNVKATDLAKNYQYVYISKDTSKIWSNISSAISNIGTLISGAKIGSLFSSIFTIFKSSKIFSFLPLLFLLK